jgi:hypothetical protein
MKERGVVTVLGCVVAAAALLGFAASAGAVRVASCSSPAGSTACLGLASAPFVTPGQARQVMTGLWNARERANSVRDVAVLDGIDTGTVQLEDHFALDSLLCHCSTWYWTKGPRRIENVTVFLPRQSRYPVFFMAEVLAAPTGRTEPAGNVTAVMFVTRASAAQPWRIASQLFDDAYAPSTLALPPPMVDQNGYDLPAPAAEANAALTWPALLAAYYLHLKDYGVPAAQSRFAPGTLTTGTDLAANRQGSVSGGVVKHFSFAAAPLGGPWVFEENGAIEVCADINEYETFTWARPHTVFEQIDGIKPNWGPDLNSGLYSSIVTTWERPVCITPGQGGLYAWGADRTSGYPIHDGGVPTRAAPGTTRVL